MNVFWHELKLRRKGLIIWAVSMLLFMLISMAKYETISAQGGAAVQAMLQSFPSTIQAVFGMSDLDLTTVAGYFGVCYLFVLIIVAVHAGLTGAGVIADEEVDKTTEFLYVKPYTRTRIVTAKLCAGVLLLAIIWLATVMGSIIGIKKFANFDGSFASDFWWLMAGAAIVQLLFFAVGAAAAAFSKKAGGYGKIVGITVFGSYLIYTFTKLTPNMDWLHYVSAFSWFDALRILELHGLPFVYVLTSVVIVTVLGIASYVGYSKRDLNV